MTDEGARALCHAIIEQAIKDYIEWKINDQDASAIIQFFRSAWCYDLVEYAYAGRVDIDYIIAKTIRAGKRERMKKARRSVE